MIYSVRFFNRNISSNLNSSCKLRNDSLEGKNITMSWFQDFIVEIKLHLDRTFFE